MVNKSRICSDGSPSSSSYMRRRSDNYPFPSNPVKEEYPPEYKADIRSVQQRYNDYRKSVGDAEVEFKEEQLD
jgi:hypothetical protein